MTAGSRFLVCLQEAGWNQARRIQQAVFLPPVQFSEKGSCKVHDESSQPGLNCLHAFSAFFQPGLRFNPGLIINPGYHVNARLRLCA